MNQLGGIFVNGCPLPDFKRKRIIELALSGLRVSDISHHLKVSNGCVSKILTRYYQTGLVQPKAGGGSRPRVTTPQVVAWIAQLKQEQPAAFAWEIRRKLHSEGVCTTDKMPSLSSIRRILRSLQMGLPSPGPFHWHSGLPGLGGKEPSRESTPEALLPRGTQQEVLGLPPAGPHHQNRSRTVFSKQQLEALEQEFQRGHYPEKATREKLASVTHLADATIRVWFSNRRARWRRWQETMATLDSRALDRAVTLTEPGARPASAFEEGSAGDRWRLLSLAPIPQPVPAAPHDQGWLPEETCITHAGGQHTGTALHGCPSLWCS